MDPTIENLTKMVAAVRQENYKRLQSIELLTARVEALEAAQQQPAPMVDTGWQNMADGSPIMEPAPPAPAEGLVERVAWRLANHNHDSNPEIWRPEAREAIREIAGWLRSKLIGNRWLVGPFIADRLEQEAER